MELQSEERTQVLGAVRPWRHLWSRDNQDVDSRPGHPSLQGFLFLVYVRVRVDTAPSPGKPRVSAAVKMQSGFRPTGVLVLTSDTLTRVPPTRHPSLGPNPLATPNLRSTCRPSATEVYRWNYTVGNLRVIGFSSPSVNPLEIHLLRAFKNYQSEISKKDERATRHPGCPERSPVSGSAVCFQHPPLLQVWADPWGRGSRWRAEMF